MSINSSISNLYNRIPGIMWGIKNENAGVVNLRRSESQVTIGGNVGKNGFLIIFYHDFGKSSWIRYRFIVCCRICNGYDGI